MTAVTPINTGDNQLEIIDAVPPANPSRARIPAAVQFGTVAAAPIKAPKALVDLLLAATSLLASVGFMFIPQFVRL
ncbi:MAG: hypothetical protein ACI9G1_000889 [Pirellulaceae bacterium]|jgi:hypothetical protein